MDGSLPRLRPMTVGDLLDETFGLYRKNFPLFAGVVAFLAIPQTLLSMAILASLPPVSAFSPTVNSAQSTSLQVQSFTHALGGWIAGIAAIWVVGVIFGIFVTGALARAISARYLGQRVGIWPAYSSLPVRTYLRLLGATILGALLAVAGMAIGAILVALGAAFLASVATALGVIFGILASLAIMCLGIYLGVSLAFFPQVVVLEGVGIWRAFKRSWRLVRGSWWRVFGILLLLVIMVGVISAVLNAVLGAGLFFARGSSTLSRVLPQAGSGIISILTRPVEFGAMTLLYYDLRIRKEAYDLELQARALESLPPA